MDRTKLFSRPSLIACLALSVSALEVGAQGNPQLNVSVSPCEWTLVSRNSPVPINVSGTHAEYMPIGNATMIMLLPGPHQTDTTNGTITASNIGGTGTYQIGEAVGPNASGSVFSIAGSPDQFGITTSDGRPTPPATLTILSAGPQGLVGTVVGEFSVHASAGTPSMGTVLPVHIEFWAHATGGCS